MRTLDAVPLDREHYRPFGDVIAASDTFRPANQGSARKTEHLAELVNARSGAQPNLSVFRCSPRSLPLDIVLLEKHPSSTQLFVPMNVRRYLVVVAGGGERPDLSTLRAFVASGSQAITYRPGVWHHPMIALDGESDFVCLVYEDGSTEDCVEVSLSRDEQVSVRVDWPA